MTCFTNRFFGCFRSTFYNFFRRFWISNIVYINISTIREFPNTSFWSPVFNFSKESNYTRIMFQELTTAMRTNTVITKRCMTIITLCVNSIQSKMFTTTLNSVFDNLLCLCRSNTFANLSMNNTATSNHFIVFTVS